MPGAGERGLSSYYVMGMAFQSEKMKILETDGGDVCTTMRIHVMPHDVYFTRMSQSGPAVTFSREK